MPRQPMMPSGSAKTPWLACGALMILALLMPRPLAAQSRAELTRLVDSPTAGVIEKGKYEFDLRLFAEGGLSCRLSAGALRRLTISVAYGGERILGNRSIAWYPRLEAGIRYRLAEESTALPALVLGYETYGYGAHAHGRFEVKSKGLYLSASKNYLSALGQFGVHAGINMTRETDDGDDDLSGWLGLDKSINEDLVLLTEFDLGRNADGTDGSGLEDALLDVGVRMAITPQLRITLFFKDLLTTRQSRQINRELSVRYTEAF